MEGTEETMELQARNLLVKQQNPPKSTRANKTHVMELRREMEKLFAKRKQILEELKNLEGKAAKTTFPNNQITTTSEQRKKQTQLLGEINNQPKGCRTVNKRAWNQRDRKIRKARTRRPTEKPWPKKPGGQSGFFRKKVRIQFVWGVRC